jgi:hypothetical protein
MGSEISTFVMPGGEFREPEVQCRERRDAASPALATPLVKTHITPLAPWVSCPGARMVGI